MEASYKNFVCVENAKVRELFPMSRLYFSLFLFSFFFLHPFFDWKIKLGVHASFTNFTESFIPDTNALIF